jgi:hypothetical protein
MMHECCNDDCSESLSALACVEVMVQIPNLIDTTQESALMECVNNAVLNFDFKK